MRTRLQLLRWCCQALRRIALNLQCRWTLLAGIAMGQKLASKIARLESAILRGQMPPDRMPQDQRSTPPGTIVPADDSNSALPSAKLGGRPLNFDSQPL
jgi:hypothetical protein